MQGYVIAVDAPRRPAYRTCGARGAIVHGAAIRRPVQVITGTDEKENVMAKNGWISALILVLSGAAAGCSDGISAPAEADFGGFWRGTFTCGETTGVIRPTLSQSGTDVSGMIRLTIDTAAGAPNVGKTWSVSGTVAPSGELLLHSVGHAFGVSVSLPRSLLPDTLEVETTLIDEAEGLAGTLAPCSGGPGPFSARRERFTSVK